MLISTIIIMDKQILSLPKQFWLPNDSSKSCHSCHKSFSAIRRRHHCRYCGLIFCNKCAKNNQKSTSEKKLLRVCEECLILLKTSTETLKEKNMNSFVSSSFHSDMEDSVEIEENILDFLQELMPNKQQLLEHCTSEFIRFRCKSLLEAHNLTCD